MRRIGIITALGTALVLVVAQAAQAGPIKQPGKVVPRAGAGQIISGVADNAQIRLARVHKLLSTNGRPDMLVKRFVRTKRIKRTRSRSARAASSTPFCAQSSLPSGYGYDWGTSTWADWFAAQTGTDAGPATECRFKPKVVFTHSNRTAGNSTGDVKIKTDYSGLNDNLPIEDVLFYLPQGVTVNNAAATACPTRPSGPEAGTPGTPNSCPAGSEIGSVSGSMSLYTRASAWLKLEGQPIQGKLFLGRIDNASPAPGQRMGTLWMVVESKIFGLQTGDDLVVTIDIIRTGSGYRGEMKDLPRGKDDILLPLPGATPGVDIELLWFEFTIRGNTGSGATKLLMNPAPSQCRNSDRAFYGAWHFSHVNDIPWSPDPDGPSPNPGSVDSKVYYELVWSSGGRWSGCSNP